MNKLFEGVVHADIYAKFRPKIPNSVMNKIISYVKEHWSSFDSMLDVGCGSGQSTQAFAPYFLKITGTDTSANQIEMANKSKAAPNITYLVSNAESLPMDDNSVDLISSGMAVHWFDIPMFLKECNRVLKPNGCLSLYGYSLPYPCPKECGKLPIVHFADIGKEAIEKLDRTLQTHDSLSHLKNRYADIFEMIKSNHKIREDDMKLEVEMNLADYRDYLSSWSGYQIYINKKRQELIKKYGNDDALKENDILDQFADDLKTSFQLGGKNDRDIPLIITTSFFLLLSERPKDWVRIKTLH